MHIVQSDGTFSPSSFIPFCSFGDDSTKLGLKIDHFDRPVCNSFIATIHNDELCYEIDLEKYKDGNRIVEQLSIGLKLFLDYNEERQLGKIEGNSPKIYFNTKSKVNKSLDTLNLNQ